MTKEAKNSIINMQNIFLGFLAASSATILLCEAATSRGNPDIASPPYRFDYGLRSVYLPLGKNHSEEIYDSFTLPPDSFSIEPIHSITTLDRVSKLKFKTDSFYLDGALRLEGCVGYMLETAHKSCFSAQVKDFDPSKRSYFVVKWLNLYPSNVIFNGEPLLHETLQSK